MVVGLGEISSTPLWVSDTLKMTDTPTVFRQRGEFGEINSVFCVGTDFLFLFYHG